MKVLYLLVILGMAFCLVHGKYRANRLFELFCCSLASLIHEEFFYSNHRQGHKIWALSMTLVGDSLRF